MHVPSTSAGPESVTGSFARSRAQQIGLWSLLVGAVALLTLLFSFLGTISSAVLAGMMAGTIRHQRRQAAVASLVFPAVALGYTHLAKADIAIQQRLLLAAVCFGSFWLTYGAALLLMSLERTGAKTGGDPATQPPEPPPGKTADAEAATDASVNLGLVEAIGSRTDDFSLEDLQGEWWCEATGSDGRPRRRTMAIVGDAFVLGAQNGDGRVRVFAKGAVRLEGERRHQTMVLVGVRQIITAATRRGTG